MPICTSKLLDAAERLRAFDQDDLGLRLDDMSAYGDEMTYAIADLIRSAVDAAHPVQPLAGAELLAELSRPPSGPFPDPPKLPHACRNCQHVVEVVWCVNDKPRGWHCNWCGHFETE